MRRNIIFITVVAFALGAIAALFVLQQSPPNISQTVKSSGKPLIGGEFELTHHTGKRVTNKDFLGKYMLVYFGYTYCPDICPTELQVIAGALDSLGAKADQITPIFITVDPERDTPEVITSYVNHFSDKMVGLTGSAEDIKNVTKKYKVYYAKSKQADDEQNSETDYLMDHSNIMYLMNKEGKYITHFTHSTDPEKLAKKISNNLL